MVRRSNHILCASSQHSPTSHPPSYRLWWSSVRLRCPALGAALFPAHELRLDAVRRFLFAYGARVGLHFRATPRSMADGLRMDGARSDTHRIRTVKRPRRSAGGYNTVSRRILFKRTIYAYWTHFSRVNPIKS